MYKIVKCELMNDKPMADHRYILIHNKKGTAKEKRWIQFGHSKEFYFIYKNNTIVGKKKHLISSIWFICKRQLIEPFFRILVKYRILIIMSGFCLWLLILLNM